MPVIRWLAIVGMLVLLGAASGWAVGAIAAAVSADYVVITSDYIRLGVRLGLLSGTVVAACALLSARDLPSAKSVARGVLTLVVASVLGPALAAAGVSVLGRKQEFFPAYEHLAHPRRYELYLALHYGWLAGIAVGTLVGGFYVWRERAKNRLVSHSSSEIPA